MAARWLKRGRFAITFYKQLDLFDCNRHYSHPLSSGHIHFDRGGHQGRKPKLFVLRNSMAGIYIFPEAQEY
jgi:hypothetical protein